MLHKLALVAALAAGVVLGTQKLSADPWYKTTKVSFSAPVQVPGMVLPAGTYIFRLVDGQSQRPTVQVLSEDRQKTLTFFFVNYDYSRSFPSNAVVRMEDNGGGSPPLVKSILYPGEKYGLSFVYGAEAAKAPAGGRATVAD